jgi:poly(A) polymerase
MRIEPNWLMNADVQAVMSLLENSGHQAFFVGGCVRNALLNAPVSDIDISTSAHPEQVLSLAKDALIRAIPTGIEHGTITLILSGNAYEVTTFRRDVATDGRRAVVAFADTITDDARRRDFTMNALYADARGKVHDPLGGLPDLLARRVRFIEDPDQRIAEDYLRILRFFRFHAWYGDQSHGFDSDGLAACAMGIDGLDNLSKERIGAEFTKLLMAPEPQLSISSMAQTGILTRLISGADHRFLAPLVDLEADLPPSWQRRLATLGGQDLEGALRLSKKDLHAIDTIREIAGSIMSPEHAGYLHGAQAALDGCLLRAVMFERHISPDLSTQVEHGAAQVFPLNGGDLQGSFHGPDLGRALKKRRQAWIDSGFKLTRQELLDFNDDL